jgi:Rho GTPase-activating protein 39
LISQSDIAVNNPENASQVLEKLAPLNQRVLVGLIRFLQFFTKPEFVAKSKMSGSNLAMVFAPAVLRCPHDDLIALQKVNQEKQFIGK